MNEGGSVRRLVGLGLGGFATVALIVAFLAAFEVWLFLRLPVSPHPKSTPVDIPPGTSAMSVANQLQAEGIIADAQAFYWLCRYRAAAHRIRAGEYAFPFPMTPDQVLDKLVQGKVVLHRVTLPEGSTIRDIARSLDREGLGRDADVSDLARDRAFIQSLGLDHITLEGYLFPETYHYPKNESAGAILKSMVYQFRRQFTEEMRRRAFEVGLSVHEVVILASIVEKEAAVDTERPLIAAVFLNRLRRGMPLQSDPTAVYDLPDFSGPIQPAHLKRQSPYNTYLIKGLPLGPICNPGARSLQAVLFPADVPFLYFVSNHDGTHQFSNTLSEHQQAISRSRGKSKKSTEDEGSSAGNEPISALPHEPQAESAETQGK